jgi:hypothetical protein
MVGYRNKKYTDMNVVESLCVEYGDVMNEMQAKLMERFCFFVYTNDRCGRVDRCDIWAFLLCNDIFRRESNDDGCHGIVCQAVFLLCGTVFRVCAMCGLCASWCIVRVYY